MKKYATVKELKEVHQMMKTLATQVNEMARWQAFEAIKRNPNVFNGKQREEILDLAKGHITYPLLLRTFREYPLLSEGCS